jgi:hypothetical protein
MAVESVTLPAPFGGLDLVTPIDQMEPQFALDLINLFPAPTAPEMRKGYVELDDLGTALTVKTLTSLPLQSGSTQLVAISGGNIFSLVGGVTTTVTGTTPITENACQTTVFANRLFIVNGTDVAQVYNGTTTADSTFTGVSLSSLVNVSSYKSRLYFVQENTLSFWYGGTNAVGASALTQEDLQYVFTRGGFLVFAGSYTNQTAQTSADLFFACSSEGEILFYAGSSPAGAPTGDWGIVARYFIGKPLGYNAFVRVNNDIWILTQQGIVPISVLFASDPQQATETIGGRINPLLSRYAAIFPFSYRWHGVFNPTTRRVYLAVPVSATETCILAWSIDSKAWCKYGLYSQSDDIMVTVAGTDTFYGSDDGIIYTAETGYTDKGFPIDLTIEMPFSFYGVRGNYKNWKDVRPLIQTQRGVGYQIAMNTDFRRQAPSGTITTGPGATTFWGAPWGSSWSGGLEYIYDRASLKGQGHSGSIYMKVSVNDSAFKLFGFEVRFEIGGQV